MTNAELPPYEELRQRIALAAERPGMWGLHDNDRELRAFVMGCDVSHPEAFSQLRAWAGARIRGTRDKYGWPYALAVLSANRVVATKDQLDRRTPLARAYLELVCEYLSDMGKPGGPERAAAEYQEARRAFDEAHERDAHNNGTDVSDRAWHIECDEWIVTYAPELQDAPDTANPWALVKERLGLD